MSKKTKNALILLGVLLICILIYIIIVVMTKKDEGKTEETSGSIITLAAGDYIKNIKITDSNIDASFTYDKNYEKWLLDGDDNFPVYSGILDSLLSDLAAGEYSRKLTDYSSLSDFGLDKPALSLVLSSNGGESHKLLISDVSGSDNNYYVKYDDSNEVMMTKAALFEYAKYGMLDYAKVSEVPDFGSTTVKSVKVNVKNGDVITLIPEWSYYINSLGETAADLKSCTENDAQVFSNYLKGFIFNRVVDYAPSDEKLEEYGLKNPDATVEIEFSGITTVVSVSDAGVASKNIKQADFSYKLLIGSVVPGSDGEFYVKAECTDSVDSGSYGSPCIFTMNSMYAKYYLGMCEGRLNGEQSSEEKLIDDNKLPEVSLNNIKYFEFKYSDERAFKIAKESDGWYYYDLADSDAEKKAVQNSVISQLMEYLLNSGYFKYISRIGEKLNDDMMKDYALDAPELTFTVCIEGEKSEGNKEEAVWELYIGAEYDDESRAVTASNTKYIYTLHMVMADYLNSFKDNDF